MKYITSFIEGESAMEIEHELSVPEMNLSCGTGYALELIKNKTLDDMRIKFLYPINDCEVVVKQAVPKFSVKNDMPTVQLFFSCEPNRAMISDCIQQVRARLTRELAEVFRIAKIYEVLKTTK